MEITITNLGKKPQSLRLEIMDVHLACVKLDMPACLRFCVVDATIGTPSRRVILRQFLLARARVLNRASLLAATQARAHGGSNLY